MALVSFVIPAYNTECHIGRPLRSLMQQTLRDFEIIVIDDGSNDKTKEKAERILMEEKFNNYTIISQMNSGVSSARNRGLKIAKGEYAAFLDADDYVRQDLVEKINKMVTKNTFDIILWKFGVVDPEGRYCNAPSRIFSYAMKESNKELIIQVMKF